MQPAGDRVHCSVVGCRRSFRADRVGSTGDIICGRCFKLADKRLQDRYNVLKRRSRRVDRIIARVSKLKMCAFKPSRLRRGYRNSAAYLEEVFGRQTWCAWQAVVRDAEIKIAMGADGAPRRRAA